jgi:hypothetical protein
LRERGREGEHHGDDREAQPEAQPLETQHGRFS